MRYFRWTAICALVLIALQVSAQENAECLLCHGDPTATGIDPEGNEISIFVDAEGFAGSVHGEANCVACHSDISEVPHEVPFDPEPVQCGACHFDEYEVYMSSLHGQAVENADPLAPNCWDCHGTHDILRHTNPKSRTNPIRIPENCGQCHAEDAPVAKTRNIEQHDILEHYEESIHGVGILQKGLTVTAVCTSCHTAHHVLPHTDPESSINRNNVVATCTQCHALIEEVHRKVIDGQLWEQEPNKVPICIDCHQPHEARKVYYDEGSSDKDCMACHATEQLGATRTLAAVDLPLIEGSTHKTVHCAQCHSGTQPALQRPCETVTPVVDCSICHEPVVTMYNRSVHGKLHAENDPDAPACLDCHLGHGTLSKTDPASPTFPNHVPNLCGNCHREGEKAALRGHSVQKNVVANYSMSIHGKGLLASGLTVTATCVNCHTPHFELPASDPESTVNPANIADTCGTCHHGVEEQFLKSIHSPLVSTSEDPLPVCSTCHSAHTISRTDEDKFKLEIVENCGKCHAEVTESYYETYHGKVSKLGAAATAKCHDCHGSHTILPIADVNSTLSRENIVNTCSKCHPDANQRFTGYLTHATHHDARKYPALFYTFWAMTGLLVGTFAFFGLHTLAWLPHSFREMRHLRKALHEPKHPLVFRRFEPIVRQMHFVLILSFFGLALTGMALKFSYMAWAQTLSHFLGGFESMGTIHRVCASVMVFLFVFHLLVIWQHKRRSGNSWKSLLLGTSTLLPQWHDLTEFIGTVKWFLGRGEKPAYGKWTYWEKFDYFAVFWGVAIIGSTGFMLWFPEFFTHRLHIPGWLINVATIIHSDEALLATGFIFTIHFFNTHFRPEKFPMDMVMFTGRMPLEELKHERPKQYAELRENHELEKYLRQEAPKEIRFWGAVFGTIALAVGFSLVLLIIYSMVFGYISSQ